MKNLKVFLLVLIFLSSLSGFSQSPQAFSYQAVVRNNAGEPIVNQNSRFRISLLLGSNAGPVSYQETHLKYTNFFGLVNLEIGNGTMLTGVFDTLAWGLQSYYIKIEADTSGGSNFIALGTTQLLAVPYALHAENASSAASSTMIRDNDGETKVTTELSPDDNTIRFYTEGQERLRLIGTRLEMPNNAGNILFGDKSGGVITSGWGNIFIGDSAGGRNTEGSINTFLGTWSGENNTTGNSNTFIGFLSGSANTSGSSNTFIGMISGRHNTTGYVNTFVGMFSGRYNTTGNNNAFLGYESGHENTTGERNTFLGTISGHNNQTGVGNVYLGYAAGFQNQTGNDNLFIGPYAGYNEMASNKLYVSNSGTSEPLIYGDFVEKKLKFWADSVEASGEIRSNQRFNVNGQAGINDTLNHITAFDYPNNKLKYRTTLYTGGIVTWLSEESEWVDTVGNPILSPRVCGLIGMVGEFNEWGGEPDLEMTRDFNNPNFWTTIFKITPSDDLSEPPDNIVESKFRENQNWDVNWGSTEFPTGTGYQDNWNNIPVPLNGAYDTTIYYVTFNCATGYYTFEDLSGYCVDSITDGRDGQKYATVLIDNRCWMAENLNIGTRIDGIGDQINNGIMEKYCYDDLEANCDDYGGFYQWNEAMQYNTTEGSQGICPDGFHLPADQELKTLEGMADSNWGVGNPEWDKAGCRGFDAGLNLKSTGGWDPGCEGTNTTGFKLPGPGYRDLDGNFISAGSATFIWSSSERPEGGIWSRNFSCGNLVCREYNEPDYGWSVRCLKN